MTQLRKPEADRSWTGPRQAHCPRTRDFIHSTRRRAPRRGHVEVLLRSALTTAVKWTLARRNVAAATDAPKTEQHEIKPFTRAEAKAFLAAVAGDRLEALYTVALTMALRQG